ncbi:hypothetical protein SAMN05444955_10525 [Lihuaxuella thermophila]|uniref:Uncharacterized protein n=1 Tax=Lihuaxuella thermophila TaxID=1173111 RepID=A0A1H8D8E5_9BACL|nr:hypothetical protein SAMN05444955_10525 [Lihuaxuella thermophila]
MTGNKGYLCENCGKFPAKYDARSIIEGKNYLVCFHCLKEMNRLKKHEHPSLAETDLCSWPADDLKESPFGRPF